MPLKVKKCHFQNEWLTNEEYSNWVQVVPKNRSRVKCSLCKTEIDISNMGVSALDSHAAGKKHKQIASAAVSWAMFFTGKLDYI